MDNKMIGDFISALRKNKNFTQKDLADLLGITDKAVSKWERGAGYPDISMLKPLADVLGTSVNELLEGKASENVSEAVEEDISKALDYADKIITSKENRLGRILAAILAITLFIAIFTSVIVNVAVNQRLSWSILVIAGCVVGGCLLIPLLLMKKRGIYYSLFLLTILIMPLLSVIQSVTESIGTSVNWLWRIGFPISVTWLVIIWFMVFLYQNKRFNLWFYICIGALLCIPGHIITNYSVDLFLNSFAIPNTSHITYITSIIGFLMLAGICLVIGLLRRKPEAGV